MTTCSPAFNETELAPIYKNFRDLQNFGHINPVNYMLKLSTCFAMHIVSITAEMERLLRRYI